MGTGASPKRRFLSALFGGRSYGSIAVGNPTSIVSVELMEEVGVYFPEVHLDGRKMADLAAAAHEVLGYDTVTPYFSVQQESAALGAEVDWGDRRSMPVVRRIEPVDVDKLEIPDNFLEKKPVKTVLESIEILRHRYGDRVAVLGKVMGPWTLSYHLVGVETFLMMTIDKPDVVRRYLDRLKEVTIRFARAQFQAGADVVTVADHATGDLISPNMYRDFLMPVHQEIIKEIGGPNILHICGDNSDRLEYFIEAGFDCFHFESKVDAADAVRRCRGKMSLIGNINNPVTLLAGTPEKVKAEVRRAIEAGVDIIAPECAVPLTTPLANLKAVAEAAREYEDEERRSAS